MRPIRLNALDLPLRCRSSGTAPRRTIDKIRRILAVVDDVSNPAVNQALLDPVRHRLASLNPARPLRFARLLFIPLDPLMVAPRDWRPNEPTLPRSILAPVAKAVRAGLGHHGDRHRQDDRGPQSRCDGGDHARPGRRCGRVPPKFSPSAPPPDDWPETGLLAAAIWSAGREHRRRAPSRPAVAPHRAERGNRRPGYRR